PWHRRERGLHGVAPSSGSLSRRHRGHVFDLGGASAGNRAAPRRRGPTSQRASADRAVLGFETGMTMKTTECPMMPGCKEADSSQMAYLSTESTPKGP